MHCITCLRILKANMGKNMPEGEKLPPRVCYLTVNQSFAIAGKCCGQQSVPFSVIFVPLHSSGRQSDREFPVVHMLRHQAPFLAKRV